MFLIILPWACLQYIEFFVILPFCDIIYKNTYFYFLYIYLSIGSHIRPNFHDHTCHEDPFTKLKKEVDQAMESIKQEEMKHIIVPSKYLFIYLHFQYTSVSDAEYIQKRKKFNRNHSSTSYILGSCRQNHRNRMREYLVSWMALTVNKQGWYKKVSDNSKYSKRKG